MYKPLPDEVLLERRRNPLFPDLVESGLRVVQGLLDEYHDRGGPYIARRGNPGIVDRWVATLYGIREIADEIARKGMFITATDMYVGVFTTKEIQTLRAELECLKRTLTPQMKALTAKDDYELADWMAGNMALHGMHQLLHGMLPQTGNDED